MENWIVLALLSMFFAGLTSVLAKFGLKNVSGDIALVVRTAVVFVFVIINSFVLKQYGQMSSLTSRDALFLILSGITTSLSWLFYYRAIKIGNVSSIAAIDKGSIVVTIILSAIFLHEVLTWKVIVGASMIVGGLFVLIS